MRKKKLSCVLLVDDDKNCHFFHKRIIMMADCADHVQEVYNGAEALEYLIKARNYLHPWPDLILLDINMPKMNGWEFLDAFKYFSDAEKRRTVVVILTSSLNPEDEARVQLTPHAHAFENKIFSMANFQKLLSTYFPEQSL